MPVTDLPIPAAVTRDGKKIVISFDADLAEGLAWEKLRMLRRGNQFVIEETPATQSNGQPATADREKFLEGVKRSHERYADAYRKLAE